MSLLCLGITHHTAPVEIRERLALSSAAVEEALTRGVSGRESRPRGLHELAILSTCNRTEIYAVAEGPDFGGLARLLADVCETDPSLFEPWLCRMADHAVADHLCRVASGLDSLVLGEPQILGQVVRALELARDQHTAGLLLSAVFQTAIRAGKRAQTETAISRNPASISAVAVRLVEQSVRQLEGARVLVVGAGEMAELAVEALRKRGATDIVVINRTRERAASLASRWGATALTFQHLVPAMGDADVVITSTGAPHILIDEEMAGQAMSGRPDRPLAFVDIAVPRNTDPRVATLPQVRYFDIDDLQGHVKEALATRHQEIPRVEAIVVEESAAFAAWMRGQEIRPLIVDLRSRAEALRRSEVDRTFRHMPQLDESERRRIEAMTESLINKILHTPTLQLKAEGHTGHSAEYAELVRRLFGLDGTDSAGTRL